MSRLQNLKLAAGGKKGSTRSVGESAASKFAALFGKRDNVLDGDSGDKD